MIDTVMIRPRRSDRQLAIPVGSLLVHLMDTWAYAEIGVVEADGVCWGVGHAKRHSHPPTAQMWRIKRVRWGHSPIFEYIARPGTAMYDALTAFIFTLELGHPSQQLLEEVIHHAEQSEASAVS